MKIVNINFMIEQADFASRKEYLILEVMPLLAADGCELRLLELTGVLGASDFDEMARSLSVQASLGDEQARDEWMRSKALPVLEAYSGRFGEKGLLMVSFLDEVL